MQIIDLLPGTDIDHAARILVDHAPARADFNGITIRARYATTRPADISAHYRRLCDERSYVYRCSPKGKADAEQDAREAAAAQATVDRLIGALPDFSDVPAVLAWVEEMAPAADRRGVKYHHPSRVVLPFTISGWPAGVNCDEEFDGEDARNFAGWIVGQWLASRYPGVSMFIAQWREKFQAVAG